MDDGEQQRQDQRFAPLPADEAASFAFRPAARASPLPRWLVLSLTWVLAMAVAAAAVGVGLLVMQERQADQTLAMAAAHARASTRPLPDKAADAKPAGPGLLQHAAAGGAGGTAPAVRLQPDASGTKAPPAMPARPVDADATAAPTKAGTDTARTKTPRAKPKFAASRAKAAPLKARPGKAKSGVKKSASVKQSASVKKASAVQARKAKTSTWPRRRSDAVAERLNAARKACRARPHAPGECNLRACDVLGSAHSACR